MFKAAFFLALGMAQLGLPEAVLAAPVPAAASFDTLKRLVGTWRRVDKPASPLRIRFYLTAGDTVLVEEWLRAGQPHSLTLYHRDGDTVIATHYCPQGNQPRLASITANDATTLNFKFRDATDLDLKTEAYQVALSFDMSFDDRVVRSETYRLAGKDDTSKIELARDR